jgi:hypothetical protein
VGFLEYPSDRLQLEGEEHERAQSLLQDSDASLHALADLVLDRVHGSERRRGPQLRVHVTLDNSKFVITDGESCGVYEEPPGICRECTPQEFEDAQHAGGN